MILAENVSEAWLKIINHIDIHGDILSPRGQEVKEVRNMSVQIRNPKKRIITNPIRKMSLPFAFGELLWYISGRNDLSMMQYYSSRMKSFSDDGETLNSAYGHRIFGKHKDIGFDQWNHAYHKLMEDIDTRQAIIHLHTPNQKKTKDEVCTLSLQFLIRNNKLDMVTNMRSNDIIWGFTYDIFAFTSLQELMANQLGMDVGIYYHNVASMHIYKKDYRYFEHINKLYDEFEYMSKLEKEFSYDGITLESKDLRFLIDNEKLYRGEVNTFNDENPWLIGHETLGIMNNVLYLYSLYKNDNINMDELRYDNIYHSMMRNSFSRIQLEDSTMTILEGCDGSGKSTMARMMDEDDTISFKSPSKDFDKMIYYHTALMTGHIVLDRFFYSEIIYSTLFKRKSIIDNDDKYRLECMLNYRKARIEVLERHADDCYIALDDDDKRLFSYNEIDEIIKLYRELFSYGINLKRKRYTINSESEVIKNVGPS